jgi:hypothetical protein
MKKDYLLNGIMATDFQGRCFYFYTCLQSEVENAMTLMGYGCTDYHLSLFTNILQPSERNQSK